MRRSCFRGRRLRGRPRERGRGPSLRLALLLLPLAGLLWAYMPLAPLAAAVPAPERGAALPGLPWLSTEGGRIVDGSGRGVILRGFNSDALLEPGARHADLEESDAALIERAGFNVVRLAISWGLLEPERGRVDTAYMERIAHTVALLNQHRLYAVLDMHFLDWSAHYGGSGAPGWAAAALVPDTQHLGPRLLRTHLDPAMNAATTYFWLAGDWQADFELVWRAVAQRFRDDSGVAGYDLYNEPHALPIPPHVFELQLLWPFYQRSIESIGGVDPNHLFIVEGVFFANFGTPVRPLRAPDLVYSPHLYTGSLVPPDFSGDRGPIEEKVRDQLGEAAQVPAAYWNGEIGIDRSNPRAAAWADTVLDAMDDAGAGWAWWQWRESRQWGIRDAAGDFLDTAYLRHLARPFLAVAPRGVRGGRGDGASGALRVTAAAARDGDEAEVAWPALSLGDHPTAQGSCLAGAVYDAATERLRLDLVPAAGCTVEVSRGPAVPPG